MSCSPYSTKSSYHLSVTIFLLHHPLFILSSSFGQGTEAVIDVLLLPSFLISVTNSTNHHDMEETASYCSGSPERTAVYTPVNRSTEDCYTQVMSQSPYLLGDGFGYEFDDVDHPLNHHIRQAIAPNFQSAKLGLGLSPLHDTITKTYEQQYKGFHSFEWNCNKAQPPRDLEDWTAASTRFLKLAGINPSISSTALFSYLHDVGDVQDYNTARLRSEGVCIVSYFDLRDAIAAYIKIKTDQDWTIQYCSQAYYSVVSHSSLVIGRIL